VARLFRKSREIALDIQILVIPSPLPQSIFHRFAKEFRCCRDQLMDFDLNLRPPGEQILIRRAKPTHMLRLLATLAFAISFDVFLFDGKYTDAVHQLTVIAFQHF